MKENNNNYRKKMKKNANKSKLKKKIKSKLINNNNRFPINKTSKIITFREEELIKKYQNCIQII